MSVLSVDCGLSQEEISMIIDCKTKRYRIKDGRPHVNSMVVQYKRCMRVHTTSTQKHEKSIIWESTNTAEFSPYITHMRSK